MAHERFKALACYQELHERVRVQQPIPEIADWLQQEKHEFADSKKDTLIRALHRYKEDIPAAELNLVDGSVTQHRIEVISKDLDELEELNKLFRLQLRRIERTEAVETKIGMNTKLHDDIDVARKLLADSSELKFRLGMYKESERSVTVNHNHATNKALDSMTSDERRRVGLMAQSLIAGLAAPTPPPAEDVPFELLTSKSVRDDVENAA